MRLFTAAAILSIGTVAFTSLAVPRLYRGFSEAEIRRELQEATPGATLDEKVEAAIEAGDIDGAVQYAALADELGKPVAPEVRAELEAAQGTLATVLRNAGDFAGAYVTGHADSTAGLAGAVISDLTVVGDVRDILSEGGKAAVGEDYSEFLLALAAVGLAAEGVTVATGGASLTVKAGISVLKVAKRTGNLTTEFAGRLVHLARAAARQTEGAVEVASAAGTRTMVDTARVGAAPIGRAFARAELKETLGAVTTVAGNAGAADAVKLMRTVRSTDDVRELATFTSRFGHKSRVVAELTGKTALRAFRATLKGLRLLIAFLYSVVLWAAGLLAIRIARGILRAFVSIFRGLFFAVAVR